MTFPDLPPSPDPRFLSDPAPFDLLPKFSFYKKFTLDDIGLRVIESGNCGMRGHRGILVPSTVNEGSLSVLWLPEEGDTRQGRMQTSVTFGTVPDIDTRSGYLYLADFCDNRDPESLGAHRAYAGWKDLTVRPMFRSILLRLLSELLS